MKRILLMLACLLAASMTMGQSAHTAKSTDFWMTFMPCGDVTSTCTLAVISDTAGTVTITNPNSSWSDTIVVGTSHYRLKTLTASQLTNMYTTLTDTPDGRGVHITSTMPIELYAYQKSNSPSSLDGTQIYPTSMLGTKYVVSTYPTSAASDKSEFAIVSAYEKDTATIDMSFPEFG